MYGSLLFCNTNCSTGHKCFWLLIKKKKKKILLFYLIPVLEIEFIMPSKFTDKH